MDQGEGSNQEPVALQTKLGRPVREVIEQAKTRDTPSEDKTART